MNSVASLDMRTAPGPVTGRGACRTLTPDWADIAPDTAHTLPEGRRLLDYEIVAPIGEGGFGIVYLAWDHRLEQHVAIKEYLPTILASRASVSPAIVVKSRRHADSFRVGMRSFLNEARMLARFDHPSLVKVLHFWEDNGTAYMAMPYYAGPTLALALEKLGRAPDEAELKGWLRPLLDALGAMHAVSCLHRDIAPDNILLTDSGPVLLDLGAARRMLDGMGPSPTVVFKPGFAPIEQYGHVASMKQGAWTDLYALAGVVYAAVIGQPPPPAVERLMGDQMRPFSELARGRYSAPFLAAIDAALSLYPQDRPQSVAEFWTRLSSEASAAEASPPVESAPAAGPAVLDTLLPLNLTPERAQRRDIRTKLALLAATVGAASIAAVGHHRVPDPVLVSPFPSVAFSAPPAEPGPSPAPLPAPAARPVDVPVAVPKAESTPAPLDIPELDQAAEAPPLPSAVDVPSAPEPAPAPVVAQPVRRKTVHAAGPAPRREARRTASEAAAPPALERLAPTAIAQGQSRCTDILQRASLEPLTSGEAAFLRKGCER